MNFDTETVERAVRAVRLSVLTEKGLLQLEKQSVPVGTLAGRPAWEAGLTYQVLSEMATEDELMWLFRVGIVRREVDGQGITDCFRLTPLGAHVLSELQDRPRTPLTIPEQIGNLMTRWLSR